jgi:phage terminase large subunit-like protein
VPRRQRKNPASARKKELFHVLEGFPDLAHDDEVDSCSGALEILNPK